MNFQLLDSCNVGPKMNSCLYSSGQVQEEISLGLPSAHITRGDWAAYDPNLIAEALFAAANTFSTLKLVYIFSINPYLGPLQISLGEFLVIAGRINGQVARAL